LPTANLKGAGYRSVHAASGDEALSLARKIHPDAITLDVMMPKPDGWDVLNTLKGDPELCEIPVIMVMVAPERGIGLSFGAVEVLTKPVDRGRLTALLNHLDRRDGPVLIVEDDAQRVGGSMDWIVCHPLDPARFSADKFGYFAWGCFSKIYWAPDPIH
jgi:DNA-binding response OmpR family regulator